MIVEHNPSPRPGKSAQSSQKKILFFRRQESEFTAGGEKGKKTSSLFWLKEKKITATFAILYSSGEGDTFLIVGEEKKRRGALYAKGKKVRSADFLLWRRTVSKKDKKGGGKKDTF